jgi:hypothetical protein
MLPLRNPDIKVEAVEQAAKMIGLYDFISNYRVAIIIIVMKGGVPCL